MNKSVLTFAALLGTAFSVAAAASPSPSPANAVPPAPAPTAKPASAPSAAEKAAAEYAAAMKKILAEAPPTALDVPYGKHPKQVLHFWKAASNKPTPLIFYIHGGAWHGGHRALVGSDQVKAILAKGFSLVSVEYRFVQDAPAEGVTPPVKAAMLDCARALQFVRSKAKEWNIDKNRIGATGGSAGGCTSLWLAFHPDLADPKSDDPVARESSRPTCSAVVNAQTSLDPVQMREWTPNSKYGGHAFGVTGQFEGFIAAREQILPWIKEYSPMELVSAGAAPVMLFYKNAPDFGHNAKDPTHTANFGVKLKERCDELKVPCEFVYPGAPNVKHQEVYEYLYDQLSLP